MDEIFNKAELERKNDEELIKITQNLGITDDFYLLNDEKLLKFDRKNVIEKISIKLQEIDDKSYRKKELATWLFRIIGMISTILAIIIGLRTVFDFFRTGDIPLTFLGSIQGTHYRYDVAVFDEKAMTNFAYEREDSLFWIYNLHITNRNYVPVRIDEIWLEVIDFEAVSDFSIIRYFPPGLGGGASERPIFRHRGFINTYLGNYRQEFIGSYHFDLETLEEGIDRHSYVSIPSNESAHMRFHVEFMERKTGIYTFTINVRYILAGEERIFTSNTYTQFFALTGEDIYRNFYFNSTNELDNYVATKIRDIRNNVVDASEFYHFFRDLLTDYSH